MQRKEAPAENHGNLQRKNHGNTQKGNTRTEQPKKREARVGREMQDAETTSVRTNSNAYIAKGGRKPMSSNRERKLKPGANRQRPAGGRRHVDESGRPPAMAATGTWTHRQTEGRKETMWWKRSLRSSLGARALPGESRSSDSEVLTPLLQRVQPHLTNPHLHTAHVLRVVDQRHHPRTLR